MADTSYVVSALNSVADWVFGLLPIFMVKDLQMHRHQKVVVAVILGFAAVGSAATIIRMPYVWTVKQYKGEFLWRTADVAIWTTVEVGIGITAGNIATLRPLMQRVLGFMGITNSTGRGSRTWGKRGKYSGHVYTNSGATVLEDFGAQKTIKTTVTIRGGASSDEPRWAGLSRMDSQENFVSTPNKAYEGGILHSVQIDTFEESADSVNNRERDEEKGLNTSPRPTQAFERL